MVGLPGLGWPRLVPARPQSAAHSLTSSSSKASSVKEAIDRIESASEASLTVRRLSQGDQPRASLIRTLPSRPELHSRASSPAITVRSTAPASNSPVGVFQDDDSVCGEDHRQIENERHNFTPPLSPPLPPAVQADVDSQESLKKLPDLPKTPEVKTPSQCFRTKFIDDLDRRMSEVLSAGHRASTLDDETASYVQSPKFEVLAPSSSTFSDDGNPDMQSPYSGLLDSSGHSVSVASNMPGLWSREPDEVLDLSRSRRSRFRAISYDGSDNPRVAIVLPSPSSSKENGEMVSPTSDPKLVMESADDYFKPTSSTDKPKSHDESTPAMYTAPQSPMSVSHGLLPSSYSFEGPVINPGSSRPSIKDFAMLHSSPAVLTRLKVVSPLTAGSGFKENMVPIYEQGDRQDTPSLDGVPDGPKMSLAPPPPPEIQPASQGPESISTPQTSILPPAPKSEDLSSMAVISPMADSVPSPAIPMGSVNPDIPVGPETAIPGVPSVTDIPGPELPGGAVSSLSVVPIPATPGTEEKPHAGVKFKKICQKIIRQGRKIALREPVLGVCLGRQLAKPTAVALKQISAGLPLEPVANAAGAVPVAAPIPV